ncbi:MAG: thioredoxin domain-containing protein [Alphaproteobacteria bacterium]|nr:thioredoxin domain-containing protein [Alphaproteobacteria bacterium]MCY4320248.1 thioredoxin domain-containing protein [Alphaproteobacteria bacterium]
MSENLLHRETSPYLLQHADNPVHWRPWGAEAFEEARRTGRPVLLSVGYAACHWCHVMAHESFEDEAIAGLMNRLFVNVKVDREERPDVDAVYQHALQGMGEQGGWPLTMFLNADGEPFWGGTYFPPEPRWGRAGFPQLLRSLSEAWSKQPDAVAENITRLTKAARRLAEPAGGANIDAETDARIAMRLARAVDPFFGGIDGAPKFPQTGIFTHLWRVRHRGGGKVYRNQVLNTLTHMCEGGIYDHLGGGFARYSTDERWLAPHFEKMLYDNAQLVDLLTLVWQETRTPLFEQRVRETIGWLDREMIAPPAEDGTAGFAAALDADSEGEEGRFYVWTRAEVEALLGSAAGRFCKVYDVAAGGNWEGHTILNRLHSMDVPDDPALAEARALLLAERTKRERPLRDDKVLADWNGLMIGALARAGAVFGEPGWTAMAARAFAFVETYMTASDGRLRHSWRLGRAQHPASLDDYAAMMRAALLLEETTGERRYRERALSWLEVVERCHADETGGWFFAAADTERLIVRAKTAADNPTPSGNGMMVEVLARLWWLTGKAHYRQRAEAAVAAFAGETARNIFPLSTLLNANALLQEAVQIVLAGDDGRLRRAVERVSLPSRVLALIEIGESLPAGHPAAGKMAVEGCPTAYVCRGPVCSLPVTDPDELEALLRA